MLVTGSGLAHPSLGSNLGSRSKKMLKPRQYFFAQSYMFLFRSPELLRRQLLADRIRPSLAMLICIHTQIRQPWRVAEDHRVLCLKPRSHVSKMFKIHTLETEISDCKWSNSKSPRMSSNRVFSIEDPFYEPIDASSVYIDR